MKKHNELFADMGASPRNIYTILTLNLLRALDVGVGICAVIAWIITKDHTFGFVLGGTVIVFFLLNLIISLIGVRMFTKVTQEMDRLDNHRFDRF